MFSLAVQRTIAAIVLLGFIGFWASPAYASGNPGFALFLLGIDAVGLIASVIIILFLHKSPDLNLIVRNLLLTVSILLSLASNLGLQMLFFGFYKDADFRIWIWGLFVLAFCSIPFIFALDFLVGGPSEEGAWIFSTPTKIFAAITLFLAIVFWAATSATDFFADTARRKKRKLMHEKELQFQADASANGLKYFNEYGLVGRGFFPPGADVHSIKSMFVELSANTVTIREGRNYYLMNESMNSDPKKLPIHGLYDTPYPHIGSVGAQVIAAVCEFQLYDQVKDSKVIETAVCTIDLSTGGVLNRYEILNYPQNSNEITIPVYISQKKIALFSFIKKNVPPHPLTITTLDSSLKIASQVETRFPDSIRGEVNSENVRLLTAFDKGAILGIYDQTRDQNLCLKFNTDGALIWEVECIRGTGSLDLDGNLYIESYSSHQKIMANGVVDRTYALKADALKVDGRYPESLNPFADFSARFNVSYGRRLLTSPEYLWYEIKRRGFKEVDTLPELWRGSAIKLDDFPYFLYDHEMKISDTFVTEDNRVHILGEFAIEGKGEVWINYTDIGLIDPTD